MKYIDAERLQKEIKRLERAAHKSALDCADSETRKFHEGKALAYQFVGILVDTLQQEQDTIIINKKDWEAQEQFRKNKDFGKPIQQEQPEVDLEDEMEKFGERWPYPASFDGYDKDWVDELAEECAKHFYELGKKAMKEQMMEGAAEEEVQEVYRDDDGIHCCVSVGTDYKPGTIVYVITIPKEGAER